ncbi:MAG: endonuclease/exonuclease/phosphatase family protein [Pseudomonadota bacterium]
MRGLVACLTAFLLVSGCENFRHSSGTSLQDKPAGSLRLASFNVHYILLNKKKGRWSRGDWERRKQPMDAAFKALDADIVAFQEMESFAGSDDDSENLARSWLLSNNPDYRAAAIGDWRSFPSTQPVFYRLDRFDILDQGWFFFSDTPDILYSRTFNGSYPAFASWVHFRDREANSNFRLINVHFDYASRDNRRRSTDLVARRLTPWIEVGETVFLAGDLNARLGSSLHETLQSIGLAFVPVKGSTYHFDLGLNLFGAIDHIGHTTDVVPLGDPVVVREKFGKTWPADHYPLVADFRLEPPSK